MQDPIQKPKRIRDISYVEIPKDKMNAFKNELYPNEKLSNKDFILRLIQNALMNRSPEEFPPMNFAENKRHGIMILLYDCELKAIIDRGFIPREFISNAFRSVLYGNNYVTSKYYIDIAKISQKFKKLYAQLRDLIQLFLTSSNLNQTEKESLIEFTYKVEEQILSYANSPKLKDFFEPLHVTRKFTSQDHSNRKPKDKE